MNTLINSWCLNRWMKSKCVFRACLPYLAILCINGLFITVNGAYSADPQYVFEFDKATVSENGWRDNSRFIFSGNLAMSIQSGVQSGVPLPDSFSGKSKDNLGLCITVKPATDQNSMNDSCFKYSAGDDSVFIYSMEKINTNGKPVLVTVNVQAGSESSMASISLGAYTDNFLWKIRWKIDVSSSKSIKRFCNSQADIIHI